MLNISIRMAAIKDGGIKMSLQGKKVLVVGTGKSGIAATELLCANGVDTVLFDGNKELELNKQMEGFDIMVEYLLKKYADGKIDNKVMSKYCKNSLSKINI